MKYIVLLFLLTLEYSAKEYAIVSSVKIQKLSKAQVRAIFLKKLVQLENTKLVPVNLSYNDSLRALFEEEILNIGKNRLQSYWIKQHYLGQRPPVTMKSQKAALQFVKNVDGAVAYVEMKYIDSSCNVIYKWND